MGPSGSYFDSSGEFSQRILPTAGAGPAVGDLKAHARFAEGIAAVDATSGKRRRYVYARRAPGGAVGFHGKCRSACAGTTDLATRVLSQHSPRSESR